MTVVIKDKKLPVDEGALPATSKNERNDITTYQMSEFFAKRKVAIEF